MKLILSIFLISIFYFNIKYDCSTIKTGKFKIDSKESGITIIKRSVDEQIEINKDLNIKVQYKVNWVDDCTYLLFDAKVYKGNRSFEGQKSDTITVKVIEVNKDYYKVLTTSNFSDLAIETKLEIIK